MEFPLKTSCEKAIAVALVVLWAVLFLPNLRTNPNWYGNEGEWMEKSWTTVHGMPRVGPVTMDFVFPYPYPPLYMLINGALLRIFGEDLVVARSLGAVTALAAAVVVFWIGTRLRDKNFGFLSAAAFLVYSEANTNFRLVRSHPMSGTLVLASVGFLVRYVQEKRLRDVVWAGVLCSLATATNYMTYPLIGAVIVTAAVVNWRGWKNTRAWGHVAAAGAAACAYGALFAAWYALAQAGGWGRLMAQVHRLTGVASSDVRPTLGGEVARFCENAWNLCFRTPAKLGPHGVEGWDWWLRIAAVGFVFLPTKDWRFRLWVPFWLLVLMYGVFKKLNNVPLFFYPATVFLPLMAVGFAGVAAWAGELAAKAEAQLRWAPAVIGLTVFALPSLRGAWGHFDTKIDLWTQHSVTEAELAMQYVNDHTTAEDFVLVPKQIYWLVKNAKKSMLTFCARYEGVVNDMPTVVLESHDSYWFDCRCQNAKYLVMASGVDASTGRAVGIDLVYSSGLAGVPERVEEILKDGWQPVYVGGNGKMATVNVRGHKWPVAVNGEYLVLSNPRLVH